MFTGLVEEIGVVKKIIEVLLGKRFFIKAATVMSHMKIGDSIAVNGVCLTVTDFNAEGFAVEAVAETLRCTNLGLLSESMAVNLESSLTLQKPLGGHLMQGHIEGTGTILSIQPEGDAMLLTIRFPMPMRPYLVKKGYIALDGMSLTIIKVSDIGEENPFFTLTLIPHTRHVTIAKNYQPGQVVNLESDIMARYAENFWRYQHVMHDSKK